MCSDCQVVSVGVGILNYYSNKYQLTAKAHENSYRQPARSRFDYI